MTDTRDGEEQDLVEIHKVWGPAELEVIKTLLESHGILFLTRGQVPQSILPMTADGMGQIKIFVQKQDAQIARKILEEAVQED